MTKTVRVTGLRAVLDKLQPFLKSIANGTVQLADGVTLNIPDQSDLGFTETSDPNVIHWTFNGMTGDIDTHAFFGLIPIHGREPVTYADVGSDSIRTRVSVVNITAVDDARGT